MRLQNNGGVLREEFFGIRVHRDDLEQISRMLEDVGFTVEYSDNTYEYDSLDEVQKIKGVHPKALRLDARLPDSPLQRLTIRFTRTQASLDCFLPGSPSATPHRIKELLRSRTHLLISALNPAVLAALFPVGWFLRASGWSIQRDGSDAWPIAALLALIFVVIAFGVRFGYAGVWLRRRHEGNFLKRNSDQAWLLLVGAILGAVLSVATKIADRVIGK